MELKRKDWYSKREKATAKYPIGLPSRTIPTPIATNNKQTANSAAARLRLGRNVTGFWIVVVTVCIQGLLTVSHTAPLS